jgi:hypothetical protein
MDTTTDRPNGFYVCVWGGGRYGPVSWHPTEEEAEKELDRTVKAGYWQGMPPRIEPGKHPLSWFACRRED